MLKKITALTLLNMALMLSNFAIQAITAVFLGASSERDALFVAMSIPVLVNLIVVFSFGTVATQAILTHRSPGEQCRASDGLLRTVTLATILLAALCYAGRHWIVSILAPGFDPHQRAYAGGLFASSLAMMPFQAAIALMTGYWVAIDRVMLPPVSLLLGNTFVVGVLLSIGSTMDAAQAAIAVLGGAILSFLVQGTGYCSHRHRLLAIRGRDSGQSPGPNPYRQSLILLVLGAIGRSNSMIERSFASRFGSGTISCLGYANYLIGFLITLTTAPVATASYGALCRRWNEGNRNDIKEFFERGLGLVIGYGLVIAGIVLLLVEESLRVVLPWTSFSLQNVNELVIYVRVLMIAYLVFSISSFISRIFYISGRFTQAALTDCAGLPLYVVAAAILSRFYGGYGLALASSLYAVGHSILVFGTVFWSFGLRFPRRFLKDTLIIIIVWGGALLAGFVTKTLLAAKVSHPWSAALGSLVYICLIVLSALKLPLTAPLIRR